MDYKERIEQAQEKLKKAENAKTVAETQKKSALEQLAEVEQKMKDAGVSPKTIKDEIEKLETKINEDLTKAENLIPEV